MVGSCVKAEVPSDASVEDFHWLLLLPEKPAGDSLGVRLCCTNT